MGQLRGSGRIQLRAIAHFIFVLNSGRSPSLAYRLRKLVIVGAYVGGFGGLGVFVYGGTNLEDEW